MDGMLLIIAGLVAAGLVVFMLRRSWGGSLQQTGTPPVPVSLSDVEQDFELQRLLAEGKKIEAIKRVRQLSGLGLKEAKDYVESYQGGGFNSARPGAAPVADSGFAPETGIWGQAELSRDFELQRLLAEGKKIEAIKRVRDLTGMGLKEAKEYVEAQA